MGCWFVGWLVAGWFVAKVLRQNRHKPSTTCYGNQVVDFLDLVLLVNTHA